MSQNRVWLNSYPSQVAHDIDVHRYKNVLQVFQEGLDQYRDRPCFTNMGVTLTFEEIDTLSSRFASFLQYELKLEKGDRIAIQMPNLLQYPVAIFGALKAGLTIVNTNPLYTAKEMKHQFRDSGVKAIFILANYASLLQEILNETPIEAVVVTEIGDLLGFPKGNLINAAVKYLKKMVPSYSLAHYTFKQAMELGSRRAHKSVELLPSDIAFLQYTGGTTGVSKGAVLTHQNIIANMLQIVQWMKPALKKGEETVITALPLYHIFSLTVNCMAFMCYGAHNILVTNPRDIPAFIKLMRTSHFTIMTGVNTLYNGLMNNPNFDKIDFSKLKLSVAGAMALQKTVFDRWKEKTGSSIFEGYGLTEASPVVCCNPIDGTDLIGTIGLPLPSTEVRLWDDQGNEVPQGSEGEIVVQGPQVMKGYWNQTEETSKVLQNGWLKTGDIGIMLDRGFFKIVDRKKDMILVSGFNVYPNEVEEVLSAHPGVLEVAVIGVADENSGEAVKAFVVKKDPSLEEKALIEFARKSLTNYKVPKKIEFRNELPKTNVGKILRRALRES